LTRGSELDALRDALRDIAADGFARIMDDGLGESLRRRADDLREHVTDDPWRTQLEQFRRGLDEFEARGRQDRSRVVAHGLRICMGLRSTAAPPPKGRARPSLGADRREAIVVVEPEAPPPSLVGLPGIGPKTAARLAGRGLSSLEDVAYLLPLAYEDRRSVTHLDSAQEGQAVVCEVVVVRYRQSYFRGRFLATMRVEQRTSDGVVVPLDLRWFHRMGGLARDEGTTLLVAGRVRKHKGVWTMAHPEMFDPAEGTHGIAVRYPQVEGLSARTVSRICRIAVERLIEQATEDPLPPELVSAHALPNRGDALRLLHAPPDDIDSESLRRLQTRTSPAHRRLAFEEFFFLQLALLRERRTWRSAGARVVLGAEGIERERLRACLPFEPTAAQWRVVSEIETDLASGAPMLRLLQGDVGSGKTAVAFAAAMGIAAVGGQAALMAPTEILASQHARTLADPCRRAGIRMAMLTGSTTRAERNSILALVGAGQVDLLVGTHALIAEGVNFRRLGLAVVDEQHRFGVEQRAALRDKGSAPHLLVMTATPIPRSLALTAFGELDVSLLDELPPGRKPSETRVFVGKRGLARARALVSAAVREGERAFVVCPFVEASEAVVGSDVEASAAALRELLPERVIHVLHGRMIAKERDDVMERFREGAIEVLVATTVIEVGVDVPEAGLILVEHAERFGLAQLHQLRGRVGRGETRGRCFLHCGAGADSEAHARVSVLEQTQDGFVVAERDLELRGPGEVFGRRQSGVPRLRFATFGREGLELLVSARAAAKAILADDPELAVHDRIARELERRIAERAVFAGEAG
jgi:ATP-dependent DNA helicase RecG